MERRQHLERLGRLEHDLGKYLRLPFRLLPRDAGEAEVREALGDALLRTRQGPGGTTGAAELWRAFTAGLPAEPPAPAAHAALARAVERALCWQAALEADALLDRTAIERDMQAVAAAIRRLVEALEREVGR